MGSRRGAQRVKEQVHAPLPSSALHQGKGLGCTGDVREEEMGICRSPPTAFRIRLPRRVAGKGERLADASCTFYFSRPRTPQRMYCCTVSPVSLLSVTRHVGVCRRSVGMGGETSKQADYISLRNCSQRGQSARNIFLPKTGHEGLGMTETGSFSRWLMRVGKIFTSSHARLRQHAS